jgi:anti-sigma regulatory factor (Ser/Thr protein kinase)
MAAQVGLPAVRAAAVALLATELAANLVKHARDGELHVQSSSHGGSPAVELLAIDHGPGIADVDRCLTDGYSTTGTMGAGLGGIRRMSDAFDVYSRVDQGTVVLARVEERPADDRFQWGCISVPAPHELVCGDAWSIQVRAATYSVMVADGLGHGPLAAEAAWAAERIFAAIEFSEPRRFFEEAHRVLSTTRGAAISIAQGSTNDRRLSFAGVGNVAGAIVGVEDHRNLVSHNGTIGASLPRVQTFDYDWPDRAAARPQLRRPEVALEPLRLPGLHGRHPAVVAGVLYRDFRRGNDDVTVVVGRRLAS